MVEEEGGPVVVAEGGPAVAVGESKGLSLAGLVLSVPVMHSDNVSPVSWEYNFVTFVRCACFCSIALRLLAQNSTHMLVPTHFCRP